MPLTYKDLSIMDARSRFERQFYSPAVPRPTEFSNPTIPRTPSPVTPQPTNNTTNNSIVNGSQSPTQLQNRGIGVIPNIPLQTSDGKSFQFKDQNEVKDYQNGIPIDEILRDRQALQRLNDPYSNSGLFGFIPGLRDKFSYSENGIGGFKDQYLADRKRKEEYDKRHNANGNSGANGTGFKPVNPLNPPMPGNPPSMNPPGNFNPPGSPGSPGSPSANNPNPTIPNPNNPNQPKPPSPLPPNPNNPGNPGTNIPNQFNPNPPGLPATDLPDGGHNYDFPPDSPLMTFTVQSTAVIGQWGIRLDGTYFDSGNAYSVQRGLSQYVTGIPVKLIHRKTPVGITQGKTLYDYDVVVQYKPNATAAVQQVVYGVYQDSNRDRFKSVTTRLEPQSGSPIQINPLAPTTPPRPPLPDDFELPKLDDLIDQLDQFQQRLDDINNIVDNVQQIGDTLNDLRNTFPSYNPIPKPNNPTQPKPNPSPNPNPAPNPDPKNVQNPTKLKNNGWQPNLKPNNPNEFNFRDGDRPIPISTMKDITPIQSPVTNNKGQLSEQAQQQIEQQNQPQPVPNQKTDSLCNDPCIADLQRKQRDNNENNTVEIEVPVFKACKVEVSEDGVLAESQNMKLKVPKDQSAMISQMFLRLFEIESQKCKQIDIAIPETMALRVPDGRPILKIQYAEKGSGGKLGKSRWTVQIPWYTGGKQAVPKVPYSKGDTRVAYIMKDGSRIIVNAKNMTEGRRVVKSLLRGVDPAKSRGGTYSISNRDTDSVNKDKMKAVKIVPTSASFYPNGDGYVNGVRTSPAWTVKLN